MFFLSYFLTEMLKKELCSV